MSPILTLEQKLHPTNFTSMSPKMAAFVAYFLDVKWTEPQITDLSITSDGILLTNQGNEVIGSADDLERNLFDLAKAAGLTWKENTELWTRYQSHTQDWRTYATSKGRIPHG